MRAVLYVGGGGGENSGGRGGCHVARPVPCRACDSLNLALQPFSPYVQRPASPPSPVLRVEIVTHKVS